MTITGKAQIVQAISSDPVSMFYRISPPQMEQTRQQIF